MADLGGGANTGQRISDVVSDVGHQLTKRGEALRLHQTSLVLAQLLGHAVDGPRQVPHLIMGLPDQPVLKIAGADDGRRAADFGQRPDQPALNPKQEDAALDQGKQDNHYRQPAGQLLHASCPLDCKGGFAPIVGPQRLDTPFQFRE